MAKAIVEKESKNSVDCKIVNDALKSLILTDGKSRPKELVSRLSF